MSMATEIHCSYGALTLRVSISPSPTRFSTSFSSRDSRRLVNGCCCSNQPVPRQLVTEELSLSMYNRWIRYCCRTGEINEAMSLVAEIDSLGSHPDPLSYVSLIETLASLGRTLEADALFQEVVRFRINGSYSVRLYNALLSGYLRKGQLELAVRVLDHMKEENVDKNQETCEILLNYYVSAGRLEESWRVVNEMKKRMFRLNSFVYGKIIRIYRDNGMWKKALGIVEEIKEIGLPMDVEIYNSIIDTFGKYGELDEALDVLEKMQSSSDSKPNISTWNSLIRWHCHHGALDMALELFTMMQDQGLYPDPRMFVNLITRLGENGNWNMIDKHFESIKCKEHKDTRAIYAALVQIIGQFGSFQDVEELVGKLKSQGVAPSANLFCTFANAYAQQGLYKQTVKVLKMMENEGIEPNLIMLNVLINAFGTAGKHMEALSIYHHIKESGFTPDVVTYSTLMKAFTRAKKYEKVCSRNIQGNGSLWVYCRSESKTTIAKCFYGS
ncbi:putative pentatricopeptide repeat-containing protein At5g36300 isoform X3 [Arabidopsis lyrata subsp. lyrata]|uniref:putative pentatricopeptide repeat-containing protein At5g36300 isoform X3 n=1 Tax=Arabidopsis lyrata subsp. lyrata TaxID=81972 RepID=UPI000A29AC06|nr:putative pentatricopeptide repeat-containing protein At5g36300 isoform X3 [Arabidopsis lyrata subsp. lyrata]|eukprot:XP_020875490.1 putative pentatricopeptide repeat-containing protein At5g36300 isoform X3 [Arabidopsis lyrata subsp. lyrata]